jgi:class 3 adenylate cyclase
VSLMGAGLAARHATLKRRSEKQRRNVCCELFRLKIVDVLSTSNAPERSSSLRKSEREMSTVRRLAAILAADVVGYSRLVGIDEAGALAGLADLRRSIIEPSVDAHSGRLFKIMGDAVRSRQRAARSQYRNKPKRWRRQSTLPGECGCASAFT